MKQAWLILCIILIGLSLFIFFLSVEKDKEINVITFDTTLGSIVIE